MAGGFEEAGAGAPFETSPDARAATLSSLRAAIAAQTQADPRLGVGARHLLFRERNEPATFDLAEAALAAIPVFERSLVERQPSSTVEAARNAVLASLDALLRIGPASPAEG